MRRRWQFDLCAFVWILAGLLAGTGLWIAGSPAAKWAWVLASLPTTLSLLWHATRALWQRETGVDLLALIAIGGALALRQELTAAVIAVMLASGHLLESFAERRARREMTTLLDRVPQSVQVYRNGALVTIMASEVRPGDRLLVKHGEVLAVDGTLAADQAALDESALTGESVPVTQRRGAGLRSGTVNAADAFAMIATASADQSTYAGVVKLVATAQRSKAPAVRMADRYAAWFVPLSLLIAGIAWLLSGDPMRALAVVVVATPCPLILAVPVAIVSGISRCAGRGILVKDGGALEALAAARTLFFDKTGTLTGGEARLISIERIAVVDEDELLGRAATIEQMSHHVTATAIVDAARARGLVLGEPIDVVEVAGAGLSGLVDGERVAVGSLAYIEAMTAVPAPIRDQLARAANEGTSSVLVALDGKLAGLLLLADQLRVEAPRALRLLRRAGIRRIVMLTGDRHEVAEAIGVGLGVDEVLAEQSPTDKLAVIRAATRSTSSVMVGDGINDAPALAAASVGVAMGARGATASAEAAGIVLLVDRLDRLAEALHIAHRTRTIALQSVIAGMSMSFAAMLVALFGFLAPIHGAILQEFVDVAVILNALRVLRVRPLRAARYNLPPEELRRLRDDHERLVPVLDRLTSVADRLSSLRGAAATRMLRELDVVLRDQLLPHEREDDRDVYPVVAKLLGGDDPMAAMSRTHREIFRLHRQSSSAIAQLDLTTPDPVQLHDIQRTLYALDAILRLHFVQEEEIYQSLSPE